MDFVLPVGPSCPFRSSIMELRSIDKELSAVVTEATRWSSEFARLAAAFGAGISPDKAKARQVGNEIGVQGRKLRGILDELENSKDFQALEAYHTLEIMAQRARAPSFRSVEQLVNWQADGLLAFADNRPLAPMPPGVDPAAMAASAPGAAGASPASKVSLEIGVPRTLPFLEADFDAVPGEQAQFLKADFQRLSREHRELVGLGETYRDFDPTGKEFYLGQMAQISFRWEELMDNAQVAGIAPSLGFRSMSEEYLRRAGLSPEDFRTLVDDVHGVLRDKVNKEKGVGL